MRGWLLLLALAPVLVSAPSQAREVRDALGATVRLADHPARIVTLTPAMGELAADLCGVDLKRIVGVSGYTDYPPALGKVPSIASFNNVNVEAIVRLKPELVLAEDVTNNSDQLAHLREMGLPVVVVRTASLAQVKDAILIASRAMNEEKTGDGLARAFEDGLQRFRERASRRGSHPKVLLELDDNPLIVVGHDSFINDELDQIGARNAYPEPGQSYPRPSVEDAVRRDPDFILVLGNAGTMAFSQGLARQWQRFPKLRAVRDQHLRAIQADLISRPGMRVLEGMALLENVIYGTSGAPKKK